MEFDPQLNKPGYWFNRSLIMAKKFVNEEITEEVYEDFIREYDWPEHPLLRLDPGLFNMVLKKMSVKLRRIFLFKFSGLAYHRTAGELGYTAAKLQKYIEMKREQIDPLLINKLALYHRIPPCWLFQEEIDNNWQTYHFHSICPAPMKIEQLLTTINNVENNDSWIEGMVLETVHKNFMFLRLEAINGSVLIEVFNETVDPVDVVWLFLKLKKYKNLEGQMLTVIPGRTLLAIYCTTGLAPFCLPIEFSLINECSH